MEHTIFDPTSVKATLKLVLQSRQHIEGDKKDTNKWIVNWKTDWTDTSVSDRAVAWVKAGCVGSLEQLEFTAHVLEYMKILERGLMDTKGLPPAFPVYGPTFYPPTVEYDALRKRSIFKEPARYLVEPVMVINSIFFAALNLGKCPVEGCAAKKVESKGITANGYTTIYGTHSNFKAIGRQYHCAEPGHGGFCTTSADYWKTRNPWEITGVPHFTHRGGSSRELYDYVTELRTHTTVGEMEEAITQLHGLNDIRRSTAYLQQARLQIDAAKVFKPAFVKLPTQILRARIVERPLEASDSVKKGKQVICSLTNTPNTASTDAQNSIKINGHPCSNSLRDIYEYFASKQRVAEAEQQMRTVCGDLGLDATVRIAAIARVYESGINKTTGKRFSKTSAPFGGGALTGVNADKEMGIFEFLVSNSPLEMALPLREYAERDKALGGNFALSGTACTDKCCEHRSSIQHALPNVSVVQDLAHLENRIIETVPKLSPSRGHVAKALKEAFLSEFADGSGRPSIYRPVSDQLARMDAVWEKFDKIGGVWTAPSRQTFKNQRKHVEKGCLQRPNPKCPCSTSPNETWHKILGDQFRGISSSITTVHFLTLDTILRGNLKLKITQNHTQPANSPSRLFRNLAAGRHHLFALDHQLRLLEDLTREKQLSFINVFPEHRFGVVQRAAAGAFRGAKMDRAKEIRKALQGHGLSDEDVTIFSYTLNGDSDVPILAGVLEPALSPFPGVKKRLAEQIDLTDDNEDVKVLPERVYIKPRLANPLEIIAGVYGPGPNAPPSSSSELAVTVTFAPPARQTAAGSTPAAVFSIFNKGGRSSSQQPSSSPSDSGLLTPQLPHANTATASSSPCASVPPSKPAKPAKISRTAQTFKDNLGTSVTSYNQAQEFDGPAYYRFMAFRVQELCSTRTSDTDWKHLAIKYNNHKYRIDTGMGPDPARPDPVTRDPSALKRQCAAAEEQVSEKLAGNEDANGLSLFWKHQARFRPPTKQTYTKLTKTGKLAKVKTCQRCRKQIDANEDGFTHAREHCDDGFVRWAKIPYPFPRFVVGAMCGPPAGGHANKGWELYGPRIGNEFHRIQRLIAMEVGGSEDEVKATEEQRRFLAWGEDAWREDLGECDFRKLRWT
ncbi:hypothetical protein P7C70_g4430, partial [Phenoliferia sp. Uapishka_3]